MKEEEEVAIALQPTPGASQASTYVKDEIMDDVLPTTPPRPEHTKLTDYFVRTPKPVMVKSPPRPVHYMPKRSDMSSGESPSRAPFVRPASRTGSRMEWPVIKEGVWANCAAESKDRSMARLFCALTSCIFLCQSLVLAGT